MRPTTPELRVVPTPQSLCAFSGKKRLGRNVIVNLFAMRPTPARIPNRFPRKMHVAATPQIPYVFSSKIRLGFNVTINFNVMRPTPPEVLVFSKENVPSSNPAGFLGFTFLLLSEVKRVLGSQVALRFKCDVANRSRIPNLFQGERASQKAIG